MKALGCKKIILKYYSTSKWHWDTMYCQVNGIIAWYQMVAALEFKYLKSLKEKVGKL